MAGKSEYTAAATAVAAGNATTAQAALNAKMAKQTRAGSPLAQQAQDAAKAAAKKS